ncbi:MAG: phage integrase SAM-like domain-containing protein [Candidatus Marinimicrobia bacterium]|nr:phage integrase SAM-like domain-containing protein [Candidatus Neomarinimicrobiota bacterium]MCF7830290.1 phage integrase SAM-like domain-containing protein [Candidatus Neomarinimicrobiota bacterium]MCF7882431.1 phage integrase SAM-like domain-containing protein [Candidatus Neomarinimicrobiota bacterium]
MIECFPDTLTTDFDRSDLAEFRSFLLQEKELSRASVNKHVKLLKAVFNEAIPTLKAMEDNPFEKTSKNGKSFKPLPEDKKRPPVMPPEYIIRFFDEFDQTLPHEFRDYVYFHTMYSIGCRPGELARIKWINVRLDTDIPHLIFNAEDTKGKKENPVPIPEPLATDYSKLESVFPHHRSDRVFEQILLTTRSYPSRIF